MDIDLAMAFKGGVPPEEWQGIIFAAAPKPDEIVINLATLYADRGFREAIKINREGIQGFYDGIGRYDASQSEVVIEKDAVGPDDVYTMGGYSSDKATLARLILGRDPTPQEMASFQANIRRSKVQPGGPWWLSPEGWKNVYGRVQPQIADLRIKKAMELGADRRAPLDAGTSTEP